MADMAPMDRCPVGRKGRHRLTLFVPEDEMAATLCCRVCGAVRRFSSAGPLYAGRLDDQTAEQIAARVRGSISASAALPKEPSL